MKIGLSISISLPKNQVTCVFCTPVAHYESNTFDTCGSPPGVMMADTLSFNAKIGVVNF